MTDLPTTLLVRRAAPTGTASLLAAAGLGEPVVAALAAAGRVFVLGDVSRPPNAPPLAAVAIATNQDGRAEVAGIAVLSPLRRRGLARRLLADTIALLQADGMTTLEATAAPGTAGAALLRSAGFDGQYGEGPGERFARDL